MDRNKLTILATADLHYNIGRSREPTEALARRVCATRADALVLAGDTAGADWEALRDCLTLFAPFRGRKLLVPGNHCLWCQGQEDSMTRYRQTLPAVAAEADFSVLDHEPVTIGRVGLAGSVGWYDYSFRQRSLGIPLEFYRAKVAPGAAAYYSEHRTLVARHAEQLTDAHYDITARWMDGQHIRLPITDEQFVAQLADSLADQLSDLAARVDRIAVFMHHLPFEQLVPRARPAKFQFAAAYMGSAKLGQVLSAEPKVRYVVCGHSHWPARQRVGHIHAINIGSTYTEKHLEILEMDA
ncbi:MAG: hypothetical protein GX591_18915 [Planctomycetes bacterium]|nr:hypothetical protein [Planctomycetota bacterium]